MKKTWMTLLAGGAMLSGLASSFAQPAEAQTTGVSNPPPAVITTTEDAAPVYRPKPSAAIPPTSILHTRSETAITGTAMPAPMPASARTATTASSFDPDAQIVTSVGGPAPAPDNSGIVMSVPSRPNEVPAGTILRTRIHETLSTVSTPVGARFTAEVTEPMEHDGRVVIPVGSIVKGRVTEVRGGRRIRGAAALHLVPESVTLPDGTYYPLHAQVFDTSQVQATKVDYEGTILRKDHIGETIAAMSLTTGGAAATGAVLGGGVGALVGAGVGAGVSTVWWLKQDRQEVIPANSGITFGLVAPMMIGPMTMGTR